MDQPTGQPASSPLHPTSMQQDASLAIHLVSTASPTGATADVLRERLRSHIRILSVPAEAYAQRVADTRARDIALHTVAHARSIAADPGPDPAASLRLLSKSVEMLSRYATTAPPPPTGEGEAHA